MAHRRQCKLAGESVNSLGSWKFSLNRFRLEIMNVGFFNCDN